MATAGSDIPRSYHWIKKRIESLDPYEDYEEIHRLGTSYGSNDFINNLCYGLIFPNFIVTEWGSAAVWRDDGGKVLHRGATRVEDTEHNNMIWWYYGPRDERCLKSIAYINSLHARLAKNTPGLFSHNDDYIYTLAFSVIFNHRFALKLGLPGMSDKEKIAFFLFWRELSKHFVSEGQVPLHGFPDSFEGCIKFCEDFENAPKPGSEQGHLIAEAIYEEFAFRWFPPGLHWFGRAMVVALSLPTTLKTHRVEPVHPLFASFICFVLGWFMWLHDTLLPDPAPDKAFLLQLEGMSKEEKAARDKKMRDTDKAFTPHFAKKNKDKWPGCPYHMALAKKC